MSVFIFLRWATAHTQVYYTELIMDENRTGSIFNDVIGRDGSFTNARLAQLLESTIISMVKIPKCVLVTF
jgi:hypothetical protein